MKKLLVISALALLSSSAFAGGYGKAGCGLGSLVFGSENVMWKQVLAATTNGTFGSQTFGITSGTSNCGGGGSSPTTEQYIEANKVSLSNDIARGQGETLKGLSELMGCQGRSTFGSDLQKNFRTIFPSQNVDAKSVDQSIRTVIGSCQA